MRISDLSSDVCSSDLRNLSVLGDPVLLGRFGVDAGSTALLAQVIPPTVEVVPGNQDALWAARNGYFFKPAAGFGSRGSYRGDKLTRRTWESMASATYIAQARSEERRVGKEGVRTGRTRWSP